MMVFPVMMTAMDNNITTLDEWMRKGNMSCVSTLLHITKGIANILTDIHKADLCVNYLTTSSVCLDHDRVSISAFI